MLFGATGDLAHKMIFPALYAMVKRGTLAVPVIGVAYSECDLQHLHARVRDSIAHGAGGIDDEAALERLIALLGYVDGDYNDPGTFAALKEALDAAGRPAHYLAIPPALFATVIDGLGSAGLADGARLIVEKPFGRDLASAMELNRRRHPRSGAPIMSGLLVHVCAAGTCVGGESLSIAVRGRTTGPGCGDAGGGFAYCLPTAA